MSYFLRLLTESNKAEALSSACEHLRKDQQDPRIFGVEPSSFMAIPGEPFAYWASDSVRETFRRLPPFEGEDRSVRQGLATADDFRFVRVWWEVKAEKFGKKWFSFAKGGSYSPFYSDILSAVNYLNSGKELGAFSGSVVRNPGFYFRAGITWPLRGIKFSAQVVPEGAVFSVAGKMAFSPLEDLAVWLAIFNSAPFDYLVRLFAGKVGGVQYEVGLIGGTPVPFANDQQARKLVELFNRGWVMSRAQSSANEVSHAFLLPAALRNNLDGYDQMAGEVERAFIQAEIDDIAFDLYGFSGEDRQAAQGDIDAADDVEEDSDDEDQAAEVPPLDALLSWAAGVAFGRFDWRLATGEREAPPEPEPFDPLPAKSPGMLPDDAEPYHHHAGILVDDPGHEHDLPRLMADVLETVDAQVDDDLRRWLRRDFFKYHLQQYSKSRRKAPIYWPLATVSGSYTLWLYYPDLTDQTLFTAVNDFVEPKLKQVDSELGNLRLAGASRSRDDEKRLEELSDFRDELADLCDTLLRIAPGYKPDHDDGVQITAAPLWPLFRHKPWQKVLKETWEKLEQGDYDWAHLAMAYWPERVREKCVTDKSLAIAHDLEHLYVEPEPAPKKTRGRKKSTGSSE